MANPMRLFRNYRQHLFDFVFATGAEVMRVLVSLVSFMILGRELGVEDYGAYLGAIGVMGPLSALLVGGLGLAVMQRSLRDREDISEVTSLYLSVVFITAIPFVTITTVVGAMLIDRMPIGAFIALAFSELVFAAAVHVCVAATHAVRDIRVSVWLSVIASLVRVSGLVIVFLLDIVSLTTVALSGVITLVLTLVVVVFWWLPQIGVHVRPTRPSRDAVKLGSQLGVGNVAGSIQNDTDKTVLNAYDLERDAGLYGAAYRVIMLALAPMRAINASTVRRFMIDDESVRGLHVHRSKRVAMVAFPLSLVIAGGVWIFAPLLNLLVGNEFDESVTMIRWLTLYFPLKALNMASLNGLLGLNRVAGRLTSLLFSSVLSLVLYVVLIPRWSWAGAAVGTVAAEAVLVFATWGMLYRYQAEADRAAVTTGAAGAGKE